MTLATVPEAIMIVTVVPKRSMAMAVAIIIGSHLGVPIQHLGGPSGKPPQNMTESS